MYCKAKTGPQKKDYGYNLDLAEMKVLGRISEVTDTHKTKNEGIRGTVKEPEIARKVYRIEDKRHRLERRVIRRMKIQRRRRREGKQRQG